MTTPVVIRLISWNVCGVSKLKRDVRITDKLEEARIILFQEALATGPLKFIKGYSQFVNPALETGGRKSGGLVTLLARDFVGNGTTEVLIDEQSILCILVTWAQAKALVFNIYAPFHSRGNHDEFFTQLTAQIEATIDLHPTAYCAIAGDLNAHLFNVRLRRDRQLVTFVEYFASAGFDVFPKAERPFTYRSGNSLTTVDYCLFRGFDKVDCFVAQVYIAQHRPLQADLSLLLPRRPDGPHKALGTAYWRSKQCKTNWVGCLSSLQHPASTRTAAKLQLLYDSFELALQKVTKRNLLKLKMESWESLLQPELLHSLYKFRAQVEEMEQKYEDTRLDEDLAVLTRAKILLQGKTSSLLRVASEQETEKLVTLADNHAKAWTVLRKLRETSDEVPIAMDVLVRHFSSIARPKDSYLVPRPLMTLPPPVRIRSKLSQALPETTLDGLIEAAELRAAIVNTNKKSAAGPDGFSPMLVREALESPQAFMFMLSFLNVCFVLAAVPRQWKEAILFVLFKGKGDPRKGDSY